MAAADRLVTVCDPSVPMMQAGQARGHGHVQWLAGTGECMPLAGGSVDTITIAFGIRNVTRIEDALTEALRVLKPGGRFLCLEFSTPWAPVRPFYNFFSFAVIPRLGALVAQAPEAYTYLVESIRRFPDQRSFQALMQQAGFADVSYRNLSFGIACIHVGRKPLGGRPGRDAAAMSVEQRTSGAAVRANSPAAWVVAVRPRTLLVAISPVLVGAALGWQRTGALDLAVSLIVLASAVLMQVLSNLQNDVGYTVRGGESTGTRTGLPRATAKGWLTVRTVRNAIILVALVSTVLGLLLVLQRGWPVLAIGVLSLLAALAYMGGPRPIAYTPYGELTVFVFFGLVAVSGTDWMLTDGIGATTVVASVAIGALAAAALAVNNHRDIAHDALVGRRTFAVTFGAAASLRLYSVLLLGSFALTPLMAWLAGSPMLLLPCLLLPAAWTLRRDMRRCPPGVAFNEVLFRTFKMELVYAVLLASGAVLGRLWGF